ncbi:hydrogenase maturation protease [Streptomyces sp. NPDC093801]|uniref:hydrogenase maturation protease n=1 Tax=Streptomyces sp. NPDC093801 TaxID=3155203 RepID=UPI00344F5723
MAETAVGTTVVGLGNDFRRDDGIGWAVVAALRERAARRELPPGTVLAQCDGDPGRLLELWAGAGPVIVVDACFPPSARPGRAYRWDSAAGGVLRPTGAARHSTHALGLSEALRLGAALGRGPDRLVVFAVEGVDRSVGPGMTPAVAAAVPRLVRRVEAEIARHAAPPDGGARTGPADGTRRTAFADGGPPA